MNRHDRATAIRMLQKMVTAFDAQYDKTLSLKGFYNLIACN